MITASSRITRCFRTAIFELTLAPPTIATDGGVGFSSALVRAAISSIISGPAVAGSLAAIAAVLA